MTTSVAALVAIAAFGFMGSLHCAAMCGPLAASVCLAPSSKPGSPLTGLRPLLVYYATRTAAYTMLGVVVGLSSAVVLRQFLQSIAPYLGIVLGVSMLAYSLFELGRVVMAMRSQARFRPAFDLAKPRPSSRLTAWLFRLPLPKPVTLGLATALLPCGFLYVALAQAALLAHPFFSGAAMFIFALVTGPALAFGGVLLKTVGHRAPKIQPIVVALVLVAASATLFMRALMQPHDHHAAHQHHSP